MRRILGLTCALAVLFATDRVLGAPNWFNDPRHFFGGFLAACLVGAVCDKYAPEIFEIRSPWLELAVIIAGAMLLGVFVEFAEYHLARPNFLASGGLAAWWEQDTVWDLQMDFLGAVVGTVGYAIEVHLRNIVAR